MIRSCLIATIAILGLMQAPAGAQEMDRFTRSNLLGTLYHEVGHALIDILDLPLLGGEEDSADAAAIHLIDALHTEIEARAIVQDVARLYAFEHGERPEEFPHYSRYSTNLRRSWNAVCFFYGGDPEGRRGFARKMGLPEERRLTCPEERDRQRRAWNDVLDRARGPGGSFRMRKRQDPAVAPLVEAIANLNRLIALPRPVHVRVEPCEQANAFYETGPDTIMICTELSGYIAARR